MTNNYEYNNCYELKTAFPKNLIFQEIIFVDDNCETSMELARKEGIKYFKCIKVFHNPDMPGTLIVIGQVKNKEKPLWKNVMKNLYIMANKENYIKTCNFLYEHIKENIIEEDIENESS